MKQYNYLENCTIPLEYLKMGDAYALCSSYEGMPISLIEAIGVGCIPVCTPVGGIVDVVHNGENGFLVTVSVKNLITKR